MVIQPLWQKLKKIADLDQKQKKIKTKINEEKQKIVEENKIIPELQKKIEETKQAYTNAKKNVDIQELNAKDLKEKEITKRNALESVKNQKEYIAIEKELSKILQQLSEQDDVLVKAWHNLDLAEKKEKTEISLDKEKIISVEQDAKEKENKIKAFEEELKKIEEEKKRESTDIPQEWLERYERMKTKVPDPVVPVINESCSACYYSVPPQDIIRLQKNALLPCRSCYRFLYYDKKEEKEVESESF